MKRSHSAGPCRRHWRWPCRGCGRRKSPRRPRLAAQPAAPAEMTVTIAHAGPLTGSIAHLGKDDENGVRLAIDEANAKQHRRSAASR